jgi:hypothetical protein
MIALRCGDLTGAALHVAGASVPGPHPAETYARAEITMAHAQVSEARDGPAAALGHIRHVCADLASHQGLLLGDPATAPWLTRTALAAGHDELAAVVVCAVQALASANPGYPAVHAAAAHTLGLAEQNTGRLAEAAGRHPDRWARASAAEDLGVSHARRAEHRQIEGLTEAIEGCQSVGAEADMARPPPAPQAGGATPPLDAGAGQADGRLGEPHEDRARGRRAGRAGAEQPGRCGPDVRQYPHGSLLPTPGLPQARHRLPGRTRPHRRRAQLDPPRYPIWRTLSALIVRMTRTWSRPPYHGYGVPR